MFKQKNAKDDLMNALFWQYVHICRFYKIEKKKTKTNQGET